MKRPSKFSFLKLVLGLIFFGMIGYNFYVANDLKYETAGDAAAFVSLGTSLAKVHKYGHLDIPGGIVRAFEKDKIDNREYEFKGHSTWRPPVWPFLIASVFFFFGFNLTYLLIFKFLLHFLGTYIFYRTLKLLKMPEIWVLIGAFLYGVSPVWQLYSRVFLSEPITLFFMSLWIYFLIRHLVADSSWWPQALLAGIMVLCHPYYIFLPFSIWLILLINKKLQFKIFFLSAVLCAAVISTWIIRNFVVLETNEVVLTTSSGAVIAKGWNQDVIKEHSNTKGDLADETLVLENYDYEKAKPRNEVERMKLYKDATVHFIKENPALVFPIIGKKLKSAFNPFPETPRPGILETGRWTFQFLALLAIVYILVFAKNRVINSLAWGLVLSTVAITILTYSGFRFRMPQTALEMIFIVFVLNKLLPINKSTS